MLELKNICKSYTTKSGYVTRALKNVSLSFPSHGLVFVLGRSGSGKSTLLNVMGGIDAPDDGELIVDGKSSADFRPADYDCYRNTYVGFVFQEYNLIPAYSVGRNVSLALELQGRHTDNALVDDALRRVGLTDVSGNTLARRRTDELSGGQKQRVAIARALVKSPRLILADEPTGALDAETGRQLYELLKSLSEEKLIVVVTHDRAAAEKYGDRVIEIKDGEVVSDSSRVRSVTYGDGESYRSVRSRLPLPRVLAMGASGLTVKRFRLVTSVLLAVIAISIFGFSLAFGMTDALSVELQTLYDRGMTSAALAFTRENDNGYEETTKPTARQTEAIERVCGKPVPLISAGSVIPSFGEITGYVPAADIDELTIFYGYHIVALSNMSLVAELNPETGESDAHLKPDPRFEDPSLCRLPETVTEIAISDVRADMFLEYGYRAPDGTIVEIDSVDDIVAKGLTLWGMKVCGVYSTEVDREKLRDEIDIRMFGDDELRKVVYGAQMSVAAFGFVCEGFAESAGAESGDRLLVYLSGNLGRDSALIHDLQTEEDGYAYSVSLMTTVSPYMDMPSMLKEMLFTPFMIAASVFCLFSVLLMINFLTVTFDFRRRELGVLRALGARGRDIFGICISESLIMAAADFVLSLLCVGAVCAIVNALNGVSFVFMTLPVVLAMFGVSIGSAALATVIPIARIMRKKPVDIINGR